MTTPTPSTLLAALIAASTATNGVITVGDTQPFDQVRLYQNPANGTRLSNQSSDGAIDTSTTALVVTGSTAPTGLVFEPNLSVLRNVTSDIKLLVDTPVALTLTINLAGTLTEMTVEAGKTAVLTLGLIAGIPMIVGAFGFFPVATDGNHAVSGNGPMFGMGALEQAPQGIYQVFVDDPNNPVDPAYASVTEYKDLFGAKSAVKNLNQAAAHLQIIISNGTPDRSTFGFNSGIGGSSFTNAPDQAPAAQIGWSNNQWSTLLAFQNSSHNSNQPVTGSRALQTGDVIDIFVSDTTITLNCAAIGYTHTLSNPTPRNGLLDRTVQVLVFDPFSPSNVSDIPLKMALSYFGEASDHSAD